MGFATPGSSDFHALVSQPILSGRETQFHRRGVSESAFIDGNRSAILDVVTGNRGEDALRNPRRFRAIGPILSMEGASAIAPETADAGRRWAADRSHTPQ